MNKKTQDKASETIDLLEQAQCYIERAEEVILTMNQRVQNRLEEPVIRELDTAKEAI